MSLTIALATLLAAAGAAHLRADERRLLLNEGSASFVPDSPCPAKRFPTFEMVAPVPPVVDPSGVDVIPFVCSVIVSKNPSRPSGVKGVKGRYEADLYVLNNKTGEFESFPVGSGKFNTNAKGFTNIEVEVPSNLFADGFESGDVSAWFHARIDLTNRKQAGAGHVGCRTLIF